MFRPLPVARPLLTALLTCAATSLTGSAAPLRAETLDAKQIIDKAFSQSSAVAFQQGTATLTMTLFDPQGQAKQRSLDVKAMKDPAGLLRTLVKFSKPADVAGIAFLVREKKNALPDQYVYVPAARVVRPVAAGKASSSFFGSDFTFGDLMPLPENQRDKVRVNRLPDGTVGKQATYVIEAIPEVEGSPYAKLVVHVDQKMLIPLKIEFFDPAGKPLKTLSIRKLKKLKGEIIPIDLVMTNVQKGSRTELVIENPNPDAKLSESDFTEEAMQR